ncbi:MAG TPA: ABC transporter permease subunit [Nitrososphaerales archaeon]|nr:ABC transporter permease subunit [Nitrososphaerales archaeon]
MHLLFDGTNLLFGVLGLAMATAPASASLLSRMGLQPVNLNGVWGMLSLTFRDAIRTKWLIVFTVIFFLIAINIPVLLLSIYSGQSPAALEATYGFGTSISESFPLIALLSLPFGAVAIVEDRESGVLQYLLSNPITKAEFFAGRSLGLLLATTTVIVLSFGGAAVASYPSDVGQSYLITVSMFVVMLLNAVMLALGLIVSEVTKRKVTAMGIGIFFWFYFTTVSGLTTLVNVVNLTFGAVASCLVVLANPIETSRLADVLAAGLGQAQYGPTGYVASYVLGANFFVVTLCTLLIWFAILTGLGFFVFMHQDAA